jgi:hypothetical protein
MGLFIRQNAFCFVKQQFCFGERARGRTKKGGLSGPPFGCFYPKLIICPILVPQPGKHLRMFHTLCISQGR